MLHEAFHVVALIAFLAAVGVAFIGLAAPLLFPDRGDFRVPALKTSLLLGLLAAAGLGADWVVHNL